MLGVVFIRQVIQSGTLGEHEGTKEQQMDCYVVRAYARSRVYTSGNSKRNIRGARGDQGTADGLLCSSGGRKELKLTCKMRAACAGSSGLR